MQLAVRVGGKGKEKTAGQFLLSDNPNTFSSEILAHLYKQHPFLGKYSVNMDVNAQDESLGYMHATFTVSNATDAHQMQEDARMGQVTREHTPPDPEQSIRIPVVVRDKKLYTFDTFITPDGKSLPLSESRLASALFDPSAFSTAPKPDASDAGGSLDANFSPDAPQTVYGAGFGVTVRLGEYGVGTVCFLYPLYLADNDVQCLIPGNSDVWAFAPVLGVSFAVRIPVHPPQGV